MIEAAIVTARNINQTNSDLPVVLTLHHLIHLCDVSAEFLQDVIFRFFFQAEDGIRDLTVTGVQTCALPISNRLPAAVNPACPTLAAAVAGSWSLACPMPAAVAEPNWSPVFPNRLPAAAHSGPRRRAAVSLAYPMHQLVAL